MHIKEYNGIEIKFPGPDLHEEDIHSAMNYLRQQIEEIGNYPDKSLFFQDPQIIDGWLCLVRAISKIEIWGEPNDDTEWEDRTETYVAYLLTLREYYIKYQDLYTAYYEPLKELLDGYVGWLGGNCVSTEGIEALIADQYEKDIEDVEDFKKHLSNLNSKSLKTRTSVYLTLSDIFNILIAVMDRGEQAVIDLKPSFEDYAKAIDDDLKEWSFSFGSSLFKEMKEDLNRHFKTRRTDPYTPELWGDMLRADEDALNMAMKQELANCNDAKQEHWGEDMKKQMDENFELMHLIYSSCYTEELFDIRKGDNSQQFIQLLTPDNLALFYDIIVRRNLIQREMFPEQLGPVYEEWLNPSEEQHQEENEDTILSEARQSKLDEIIGILQNGNWKLPATAENIKQLLNTIFGRDMSLFEDGDEQLCEAMWAFVESGTGNRMEVVPANLAGFFLEENLLNGSPKTISDDLFGKNNNQTNNINKGNSRRCSNAFKEIIPILTKYTNKIIRQA